MIASFQIMCWNVSQWLMDPLFSCSALATQLYNPMYPGNPNQLTMRGNPLPDTQNEIGSGVTELRSLHRTTKKPKPTYSNLKPLVSEFVTSVMPGFLPYRSERLKQPKFTVPGFLPYDATTCCSS
jgi:hypothetical protein